MTNYLSYLLSSALELPAYGKIFVIKGLLLCLINVMEKPQKEGKLDYLITWIMLIRPTWQSPFPLCRISSPLLSNWQLLQLPNLHIICRSLVHAAQSLFNLTSRGRSFLILKGSDSMGKSWEANQIPEMENSRLLWRDYDRGSLSWLSSYL